MRFGDAIVDIPSVPDAREEAGSLHLPKVFRRHVRLDVARLGEFPNGEVLLEQHLDDPQAMFMGQQLQAIGGILKSVEICQFQCLFRLG